MSAQTAAEAALLRKYELARKKKEEKARQHELKQQEQQQGAQKKPAGPAAKAPAAPAATQKAAAAPAAARKPDAEPAKQLSAHEKALQALQRAAKGGASARTGIGQLSRKRPAGAGAGEGQAGEPAQQPAGPSADGNGATAAASQAAPQHRAVEADVGQAKPDPVAAAKEALAAKAGQAAAGRKLPGLKRPAAHRQAPASAAAPEPGAGSPGRAEKRKRTDEGAVPSGRGALPGVQLFVGDLPVSYGPAELEELFGHIAPVSGARVIGTNCYGFVTFPTEDDAAYVLQASEATGIFADGAQLRVSRAGANKATWQGLPPEERAARYMSYQEHAGEHPKVREARLAGRSLAQQIQQGHLPGMDCGPPPERALVCYDDL